jgi:hypothetical protein
LANRFTFIKAIIERWTIDGRNIHYKKYHFFAATNVVAKNAKLLQKMFFAAKQLLLHVADISAVAKSFARTINVAAITSIFTATIIVVL